METGDAASASSVKMKRRAGSLGSLRLQGLPSNFVLSRLNEEPDLGIRSPGGLKLQKTISRAVNE